MLHKITLPLFLVFITICNAQIRYEKGYFINNSGEKTECLIKNIDWNNNPTDFSYKLSEDSEEKTATIIDVKEFSVSGVSLYQRNTVNIDRSGNVISNYSRKRNPEFREETLFLKVLIQGDANLYIYREGNLTRFFFETPSVHLEQLIFKNYFIDGASSAVDQNNYFRQQLTNALKCDKVDSKVFRNLFYSKRELTKVFKKYNECKQGTMVVFDKKSARKLFNITAKIGGQQSRLEVRNNDNSIRNVDFSRETGFRVGLEAEYVLPFHKNKWSLSVAPTYQSYTSEEKVVPLDFGRFFIFNASINTIDIPFSVRHYFFLTENSKIFVNGSFVISAPFNSEVSSSLNTEVSSSPEIPLDVKTANHFALGFGFMYKRYSMEVRADLGRDVLKSFVTYRTNYAITSINFGYRIF